MGSYLKIGQELEAIISPDKTKAVVWDLNNYSWVYHAHQYEIVSNNEVTKPKASGTINDLFTQELSEITVRFK